MYAGNKEYVKNKYDLTKIQEVEQIVAEAVGVTVPFNNYITGCCAFAHKAGIHVKAVLNNPSTYEILNPQDFGITRYVIVGHRLTGWNAVKNRAAQLDLDLTNCDAKMVTTKIKELADIRPLSLDEVDILLSSYQQTKMGNRHIQFLERIKNHDQIANVSKVEVDEQSVH